jgi:hypothetical protein
MKDPVELAIALLGFSCVLACFLLVLHALSELSGAVLASIAVACYLGFFSWMYFSKR